MNQERGGDLDLTQLSLWEAAQRIRSKTLSPLELTRAYLKRIEALEGRVNAFISVTGEEALAEAAQAEADAQRGETRDGRRLGALHGAPLALKDLFETRGVRTTAGAKFLSDYVPNADAYVVEKLREAGAVWLGKTNMHEIALGLTSVNPHYGPVRNPWRLSQVAGGSSGGSAAAIAAGLCPAALGTDTGGSIRVPAALCGVAGLKPTYGRVSLRGVLPLSWNLDHAGPMARRVKDLALLLQVIAGYDPLDPYSQNQPVDDYLSQLDAGVRGWRVALAEGDYFSKTSSGVRQRIEEAARVFEELGARVETAEVPLIYEAALSNGRMVIADAAALYAERLREQSGDFGADVRQRLLKGASTDVADYIQARRVQSLARRAYERFFEQYDLLLMPTTPITAPPVEGEDALELAGLLTRYTAPFNLTGLPALSLPCGFADGGLPAGLQLVSPPWSEARLLRAGASYENATGWHLETPDLA